MPRIDSARLFGFTANVERTQRAVVIGASLAGLLAARALSGHFDEVLILERGDVPDSDRHRKETPHTRHAHGLLARGWQALEAMFPGIGDEWVGAGGRVGDLQRQVPFYAGRRRFALGTAGVSGMAVGRVVIEGSVRRRVLALPGVQLATGCEVPALEWSGDGQRVTGVRVRAEGREIGLPASLVVDASGRASHLPQWLGAAGFEAPEEERIACDIRYATAYFERQPGELPDVEVVLCSATADCPLPGVLLGQEGDRWVITLGGYGRDIPPLDRPGFVQRACQMAPEIAAVALAGRFVADPIGYRFPHSQRRRYERLRRFPEGLLAIGDALCSFNPIYGQGMTVAACQAERLRECLAQGGRHLASRYFKAAARIIDTAWTTAAGADLSIPAVPGARPLPVRLINAYVTRVQRVAHRDPAVALAFLKVAHLLDEPPSLMRPAILARVFRPAPLDRGDAERAMTPEQPLAH